MYPLKRAMVKYLNCQPLVVNEDVFPVLGYLGGATTNDHGADRSVACMAAVAKYGAPLLVLDFGTATTVDAVDANGVYVGGSICAGLQVSMNALAQNAAMLPNVELTLPDQVLGYDTVSQIQIGVVGGYVGSMEYLIRRTRAQMEEPDESIKVVATGGLSRMVAEHTPLIDAVDSELILDGLVLIYEDYKKKQ
jgi:type III pantothenate kinase